MEKKAKAEAKRARRKELKESGGASDPPEAANFDSKTTDDETGMPNETS